MLNKSLHQIIMGDILKRIASEPLLSSLLGLKGGTCAYFFYRLPRFSVDLDFDLFSSQQIDQEKIFAQMEAILKPFGTLKDAYHKRNTLFWLLSYGEHERNVKIEINSRFLLKNLKDYFELKQHLGIPILAAKSEYLFVSKLKAIMERKETAIRDIYDVHFFMSQHWNLDTELLTQMTGNAPKQHLSLCIQIIEKIKSERMLEGLGELLMDPKKDWVKDHLKKEALFQLKNYLAAL